MVKTEKGKELTDSEKLEVLMGAFSSMITTWFSLHRVLGQLETSDLTDFLSIGQHADEVLKDLLEPIEEAGVLDEILRKTLPALIKQDLNAKEVSITW